MACRPTDPGDVLDDISPDGVGEQQYSSADSSAISPTVDSVPSDVVAQAPIAQLNDAFSTANAPTSRDLIGVWILTRSVTGERDVRDASGIRRSDISGSPFDWVLTFVETEARLVAVSSTAWEPSGDRSSVRFDGSGAATFRKDYGGDAPWEYRCRIEQRQLTCLLVNNEEWHGLQFDRQSPG